MTDDLGALVELGGAAAVEIVASALVAHGAHAAKCANCGAPVIGPFCAVCGQERNTHRRSVRQLLGEFFVEIASFDSRILRTAFALVARPGELSLAFQEGRPRRYVPALRLYLFVSLIFFLVLSATGLAIMQFDFFASPEKIVTNAKGQSFAITQYDNEPIPIPDWKAKEPGPHYSVQSRIHFFAPIGAYHTELPAAVHTSIELDRQHAATEVKNRKLAVWIKTHVFHLIEALQSDPAAVNGPLTQWIPRVLFILLPLFALLLAAFYWRQRRRFYFVDHLVFSLNTHSFMFVAILIAVALGEIMPGDIAGWAALGAIALYLLLSMRRFYKENWFWTVLKFLTVSSVYTVFFLFPALVAVIVISLLGI